MPPRAAKRKAKGPKDDDPWEAPDDQPRRKSRPSTLPGNGWDGWDDGLSSKQYHEGRPSSDPFQNWGGWQTKFNEKEKGDKRQFAEAFRKNIEEKREDCARFFCHSNDELDVTGSKYARLIKGPYNDTKLPSRSSPKPQAARTRRDHPLFKAGQHLFQRCHDLIADHNQANNMTTHGSTKPDSLREEWREDIARVQEVLLYGRQHGENIVECIVIPSPSGEEKGHLLTPDKEELSETGRMAVDMYRKSAVQVMKGPTWGEVARGQAGAFGRAINGLNGV